MCYGRAKSSRMACLERILIKMLKMSDKKQNFGGMIRECKKKENEIHYVVKNKIQEICYTVSRI